MCECTPAAALTGPQAKIQKSASKTVFPWILRACKKIQGDDPKIG